MIQLIQKIESGIEICSRPYLTIAKDLGITEDEVVRLIQQEIESRKIRRFGPVVKHHEFGYRHNAMIVWDVKMNEVEKVAYELLQFPFVTLCYQRKSIHDVWPYELYCMVHAKDESQLNEYLVTFHNNTILSTLKKEILVSHRSFKQKGARYRPVPNDWRDKLLTRLQQGIACVEFPFAEIANELDLHESEIVAQIQVWLRDGTLTRFGPLFNIEKMGGEFTLVAMEVPKDRFDHVTEIVNSFVEVAHNYEREHQLNMWFVLGTISAEQTNSVLKKIEEQTQLKCYAMPKEKEFYLNLQLEAR